MKHVLYYSGGDSANVGWHWSTAVNAYSRKYRIHYFVRDPAAFGSYRRGILNPFLSPIYYGGRDRYKNMIKTPRGVDEKLFKDFRYWNEHADLLMIKHEAPVHVFAFKNELVNTDRPFIRVFCGFPWEKKHAEYYGILKDKCDLFVVETRNLLVGNYQNLIYVPQTFPPEVTRKATRCTIIGHSPANMGKKGSKYLIEAVEKLQKKYHHVHLNLQSLLPHRLTIELKRVNHIFMDQINNFGTYGMSGVEAMALGSILINSNKFKDQWGIDPATKKNLYSILNALLGDSVHYAKQFERCQHYYYERHHPRAVATCLDGAFDYARQLYPMARQGLFPAIR